MHHETPLVPPFPGLPPSGRSDVSPETLKVRILKIWNGVIQSPDPGSEASRFPPSISWINLPYSELLQTESTFRALFTAAPASSSRLGQNLVRSLRDELQ